MKIRQELIQKLKEKKRCIKDKKSPEYKITKEWLKNLERIEANTLLTNELKEEI